MICFQLLFIKLRNLPGKNEKKIIEKQTESLWVWGLKNEEYWKVALGEYYYLCLNVLTRIAMCFPGWEKWWISIVP